MLTRQIINPAYGPCRSELSYHTRLGCLIIGIDDYRGFVGEGRLGDPDPSDDNVACVIKG